MLRALFVFLLSLSLTSAAAAQGQAINGTIEGRSPTIRAAYCPGSP